MKETAVQAKMKNFVRTAREVEILLRYEFK